MTYKIRRTSQFKRDFRLAEQSGLPTDELEKVIKLLANGETLPAKYKDHKLKGKWKNHRECHIKADWLLIYLIESDILVLELTRTGTHSDLFKK